MKKDPEETRKRRDDSEHKDDSEYKDEEITSDVDANEDAQVDENVDASKMKVSEVSVTQIEQEETVVAFAEADADEEPVDAEALDKSVDAETADKAVDAETEDKEAVDAESETDEDTSDVEDEYPEEDDFYPEIDEEDDEDELSDELIPLPEEGHFKLQPDAKRKVVGVRLYPDIDVIVCDPGTFDIRVGDEVMVETAKGLAVGVVARNPYALPQEDIEEMFGDQDLPRIERWARDEDILNQVTFEQRALEALSIAQSRVDAHGLEMKLLSARFHDDESKLTFEFTADGRVDFRELVKDLASIFRMRIELRQIGVRDQASKVGGIGPCGREFCCATFLDDFEPVTIRMAKDQDLSMNPNNISGCCGRLLCCLRYEHEAYLKARKRMPRVGHTVTTIYGRGKVVSINLLTEELRIELFDAPDDDPIKIHLSDLSGRDAVAGVKRPRKRIRANVPMPRRRTANKKNDEEADEPQNYDFQDLGGASPEAVEAWEEKQEEQDEQKSNTSREQNAKNTKQKQTKKRPRKRTSRRNRRSSSKSSSHKPRARARKRKPQGENGAKKANASSQRTAKPKSKSSSSANRPKGKKRARRSVRRRKTKRSPESRHSGINAKARPRRPRKEQ